MGDEKSSSSSRARVVIVDSDEEEEEDEEDEEEDDFFDESVDSCADLLCSPFRLLRVGRDAALSSSGHEKAAEVGALAADDDFFRTAGIELCVHSPLQRAARTLEHVLCPTYIGEQTRGAGSPMRSPSSPMKTYGVDDDVYGDENGNSMGGSSDDDSESSRSGSEIDANEYRNGVDGDFMNDRLQAPLRQKSMRRRRGGSRRRGTSSSVVAGTAADMDDIREIAPFPIVCCESLAEETPGEFLVARWKFRRRIRAFEVWLARRSEGTVFITGHSAFFKHMLGQRKKFNNCDVFRVDFTVFHGGESPQTSWQNPRLVYRVCRKKSDTDQFNKMNGKANGTNA